MQLASVPKLLTCSGRVRLATKGGQIARAVEATRPLLIVDSRSTNRRLSDRVLPQNPLVQGRVAARVAERTH